MPPGSREQHGLFSPFVLRIGSHSRFCRGEYTYVGGAQASTPAAHACGFGRFPDEQTCELLTDPINTTNA